MRGGALPLLAFAFLLTVLGAINWIWTGDTIEVGTFGFAVLVVVAAAATAALVSRGQALRRGPPEPPDRLEGVPELSVGSWMAGLGLGSLAFGFAFGRFPVYFGTGLLVVGVGRIAIEVRTQRRSERLAQERRR